MAPKGFAYVEFAEQQAVGPALALDGSVLRERNLKVSAKRTNVPGYNQAQQRGAAMRGGARGIMRGRAMARGRGRGRGASYAPY